MSKDTCPLTTLLSSLQFPFHLLFKTFFKENDKGEGNLIFLVLVERTIDEKLLLLCTGSIGLPYLASFQLPIRPLENGMCRWGIWVFDGGHMLYRVVIVGMWDLISHIASKLAVVKFERFQRLKTKENEQITLQYVN